MDTDSLTSRSPRGNAAPSHGVELLRTGGADTEEGAFHVLTQGSSTHTLQGFTFIHICEQETTGGRKSMVVNSELSNTMGLCDGPGPVISLSVISLLVTNPEFPLGAFRSSVSSPCALSRTISTPGGGNKSQAQPTRLLHYSGSEIARD